MIVVVEGPSAAGKTTWAQRHAGDALVPEEIPAIEPPADPASAAAFWAEVGEARWERAIAAEERFGIAVCDTDPLKLHYSWSLWRIGAGSESDFRLQAEAYRTMLAAGRIGFADAYFVSIPDMNTLASRKSGDASRRRRNFALHARLAAPLRDWYAALDAVRPGSVHWRYPDEGVGRADEDGRLRYGLAEYDELVRRVVQRRPSRSGGS